MKPNCWVCRHSTGWDPTTAEREFVRNRGYGNDHVQPRDGVVLVCSKRQVIACAPVSTPGRPCRYEREGGTGPLEGDR